MTAADRWYVQHKGKTLGPVGRARLQELIVHGKLPEDAVVRNETMPHWSDWRELSELSPAGAAIRLAGAKPNGGDVAASPSAGDSAGREPATGSAGESDSPGGDGEWYYAKNGQRHGPLGIRDLEDLARNRLLAPTDLVWTESMPDWLPAESVVESNWPAIDAQRAVAPVSRSASAQTTTVIWKIPQLVGSGILFAALFVPWWMISLDFPLPRPRMGSLLAGSDAQVTEEHGKRLLRMYLKNGKWYGAYGVEYDLLNDLDVIGLMERAERGDVPSSLSASALLWGWNTAAGTTGFACSLLVATAALLPMCVRRVRPYGWIGSFGAAAMSLGLAIWSLVWILTCPGEDMSPYLSQGIIVGPYLVLVGSLLVLAFAVVDGVLVSRRFVRQAAA